MSSEIDIASILRRQEAAADTADQTVTPASNGVDGSPTVPGEVDLEQLRGLDAADVIDVGDESHELGGGGVPNVAMGGGEQPSVQISQVSPDEATKARDILRLLEREALGTMLGLRTNRKSHGSIWRDIEAQRTAPDIWAELHGQEAPQWMVSSLRAAVSALSSSLNAKQKILLEQATAGALLRVLVDADPRSAAKRLQDAARKNGFSVDLADTHGMRRSNDLLEVVTNGERVLRWASEAGVAPSNIQSAVVESLALYPPTAGWISSLDDTITHATIVQTDRPAKPGELNALTLFLATQKPEVLEAIPAALRYRDSLFRGNAGKLIDVHFPTRVLFALHGRWRDQSSNVSDDFARYTQATPNSTPGVNDAEASRTTRNRFYLNYGLLALGGMPSWVRGERRGQMFADLIGMELADRDGAGQLQIDEASKQRVEKFLTYVRQKLQFEPPSVAKDYAFLVDSKNLETQIRGIGRYLATLPYRQHLLGQGNLSIWPADVLDAPFKSLLAAAYRPRPEPPVNAPIPFDSGDAKRVKEAAGLRALLVDQNLRDIVPFVVFLLEESSAAAEYYRKCEAADITRGAAGATEARDRAILERLSSLPSESRVNSPASLVLGLLSPAGERSILPATGEFGSPADLATMVLGVVRHTYLASSETSIFSVEAANDIEPTAGELESLASRWSGASTDWKALYGILDRPCFQEQMSPASFAMVTTTLGGVLQPGATEQLPLMHYSQSERAHLENVIHQSSGPSMLRGTMEPEMGAVLTAAAYAAGHPQENIEAPWRTAIAKMEESVRLLGRVNVAPLPVRGEDGVFRRPRGGVTITSEDLNSPGNLESLARRIGGLKPDEPLALPRFENNATAWDSPSTWTRTYQRVRRATAPIIEAVGGDVKPSELSFVLRHASMLSDQHSVLLEHVGALADATLGKFDPQKSHAGIDNVVKRTKVLLEQARNPEAIGKGPSAFSVIKKATLVPSRPAESQPALPTSTITSPPSPIIEQ